MTALRPRRIAVIVCAAASFVVPARADDWGDCQSKLADKILHACTAVIEKGGRSPQEMSMAHVARGLWYRQQVKPDEAMADFERAATLDPNSYEAIANRGISYRVRRRWDDALADFDR